MPPPDLPHTHTHNYTHKNRKHTTIHATTHPLHHHMCPPTQVSENYEHARAGDYGGLIGAQYEAPQKA